LFVITCKSVGSLYAVARIVLTPHHASNGRRGHLPTTDKRGLGRHANGGSLFQGIGQKWLY
jgi:hypothetical protein